MIVLKPDGIARFRTQKPVVVGFKFTDSKSDEVICDRIMTFPVKGTPIVRLFVHAAEQTIGHCHVGFRGSDVYF